LVRFFRAGSNDKIGEFIVRCRCPVFWNIAIQDTVLLAEWRIPNPVYVNESYSSLVSIGST
jgi:hypothetical protein